MRIVIAPDKFKGSLTAAQVAAAVAEGIRQVLPQATLDLCPLSDGGEGLVEAMVQARGGTYHKRIVTGPLVARKVEATFGMLADSQTAVIEMAAASGLALLPPRQRNPMRTTTYGTGELLRHAVAMGARQILLGIGGSATVDAGIGCAQACGAQFTFENGATYSAGDRRLTGGDLANILRATPVSHPHTPTALAPLHPPGQAPPARHIDLPDFDQVRITVACDVGNPLYGENGAARIFGPQKGATEQQVQELDAALRKLATRLGRTDLADAPGAGAAGGLGFGMMAFFGAQLRSGIQIVSEALNLRSRLTGADLCITAEGRLDAQSVAGKAPIGVAAICRELRIPCIALTGTVGPGAALTLQHGIDAIVPIVDAPMTLQEATHDAPRLITQAAATLLRLWQLPRRHASAALDTAPAASDPAQA